MKVNVLDRENGSLIETLSVEQAADRIRGWDFAPTGWHEAQLTSGREFASAGAVYQPVADESDTCDETRQRGRQ